MKFGDTVYWLTVGQRPHFGPDYDILHSGRVIAFDDEWVCLSYQGGATTGVYGYRPTGETQWHKRSEVHPTPNAAKLSPRGASFALV